MTIKMTENEYREYRGEYVGICLACENRQDSVEPDATNYCCDSCEENKVFGIEHLLIVGEIEFVEDEDDPEYDDDDDLF
jgi:hypothetical protein